MKITIPNYPKLFLKFLLQTFKFKAYIVVVILPFALGIIFKGNRQYITDGIYNIFEFYSSTILSIIDFVINPIYQLSNGETMFIFALLMGFSNYILIIFPFFIVIEIFYLKYRLKGLSTQEIKEIFAKKEALKEIKKAKDKY